MAGNRAAADVFTGVWGKQAPVVQRHSINDAPAPPDLSDEDEPKVEPVQRVAVPGEGLLGAPVQRNGWVKASPSKLAPANPIPGNKAAATAWKKASAAKPGGKAPGQSDLAKYMQAFGEYVEFLGGGPYTIKNLMTENQFGKFDAAYWPANRLLAVDMRIKFTFPDDGPVAGEKKADATKREQRHKDYVNNFINTVTAAWSGKFQFANQREPKGVWGLLNPVSVKINVTPVDANQHFLAKIYKKKEDTANVTSGQVLSMFKGDEVVKQAFNPDSAKGELKRVKKAAPPIVFDYNSAALRPDAAAVVKFLAFYLKNIRVPAIGLGIEATSSNAKLAAERAKTVKDALVAGGVAAPHSITVTSKTGMVRRAVFHPTIDPAWRNVQDITAHEFGHMLGLDDEYATAATKKGAGIETYARVKQAMGQKYADLTQRAGIDSASVMDGGSDVRVTHYITMWEVLGRITSTVAAKPTPKFSHDDWKFKE